MCIEFTSSVALNLLTSSSLNNFSYGDFFPLLILCRTAARIKEVHRILRFSNDVGNRFQVMEELHAYQSLLDQLFSKVLIANKYILQKM